MKGSYALLIYLSEVKKIKIGRLGTIDFNPGFYVYIGSALQSLSARINRHLRSEKKLHWHIDYFLQHASIVNSYYKESNGHEECQIAKEFLSIFESIAGFGCSDCSCKSHLFYGSKQQLLNVIDYCNMLLYKKANT